MGTDTGRPKFHCRRQSGMNFGYVTVNGVNSNVLSTRPARCFNKYLTDISNLWYVYHTKTGVDFSVL